jgi:hypothetical protein
MRYSELSARISVIPTSDDRPHPKQAEHDAAEIEDLIRQYYVRHGELPFTPDTATVSSNIRGYRDLPPEAIQTMNDIKALEGEVGELWKQTRDLPDTNARWLATARTWIQIGFMLWVRSVAIPADPYEGD